ncbi:MAG: hypothetical protein IJ071_03055 [Ruminococcus sp.]|nr:hypothetical protein [Ruminococcus sp.]
MDRTPILRTTASLLGAALAAASVGAPSVPAEGDSVSAVITTTDGDKVDVTLNEEMFLRDSSVYHHDIGMLTVALASCAYNNSSTAGQGKYISDAYEALGFSKEKTALFSYSASESNDRYGMSEMQGDSQAFSIASRKLGETTLLSITFRGTDSTIQEDVNTDLISALAVPYLDSLAGSGFADFSKKAARGLAAYIENEPEISEAAEQDKLKIVVTGHSLGAAGANLFGTYLDSGEFELGKVSNDDIFVYTYACPTTCAEIPAQADYSNIINIMNRSDIVTELPGTFLIDIDIMNGQVAYADGFAAGQKRIFDSHEYKSIVDWSGHHPDRYIHSLEDELTPEDFPLSRLEEGYCPLLADTCAQLADQVTADSEIGAQALGDIGCGPKTVTSFTTSNGQIFAGILREENTVLLCGERRDESSAKTVGPEALKDEIKAGLEDLISAESVKDGFRLFVTGEGLTGSAMELLASELLLAGRASSADGFTFASPALGVEECSSSVYSIHDISELVSEGSLSRELIAGRSDRLILANGADSFSQFTKAHLSGEAPSPVKSSDLLVSLTGRVYIEVQSEGKVVGKAAEPGDGRDVTPVPAIESGESQFVFLPSDGSCTLRITGRDQGSLDLTAESLSGGEKKTVIGASMETRKVMELRPESDSSPADAPLYVLDGEGRPAFVVQADGSEKKYHDSKKTAAAAAGGAGAAALAVGGAVAFLRRKKNAES